LSAFRAASAPVWLGLATLAGFAFLACGGSDGTDKPVVEAKCDVPKLFSAKCSGSVCHSTDDPDDLNLVDPGVADRLVGVSASDKCSDRMLVEAGNPEGSFLYQKVTQKDPACGNGMPPDGTTLTAKEISCIKDYILDAQGGPSCETCGTIQCVELASDVANCGACGTACDEGMICARGACINPCTAAQTLCGSSCVDVQTDEANCGRCNHRCGTGTTCDKGACSCDDGLATVGFEKDILPIFEASCGGGECHDDTNKLTTLDLDDAVAHAQLVGVDSDGVGCTGKRVVAGEPDQSFLVDKLMGGDLCYGKRMPRDKELPDAAIAKVIAWICEGAKND
jgi:hypothetical protein